MFGRSQLPGGGLRRFALPPSALFFLLAAKQMIAQEPGRRFEFFAGGGASLISSKAIVPPSHNGMVFSPTKHLSLGWGEFSGLRYYLTSRSAVEVNRSYINNEAEYSRGGSLYGPLLLEASTLSFNYVRYLRVKSRVRPFVVGGSGFATYNTSLAGWGRNTYVVDFGLGTDVQVSRRLALRFDVRDFVMPIRAPFHTTAHNLTPSVGLVFAFHTPRAEAGAPSPRYEFFAQGGGSFLTDGSSQGSLELYTPTGKESLSVVNTSTFSSTGRFFGGFRVYFTARDAFEAGWSQAPNHYVSQQVAGPPIGLLDSQTRTVVLNAFSANYVRYLGSRRPLRPFVTVGLGLARFSGMIQDSNRFSANLGIGSDTRLNNWISLRVELRDFIVGQPSPVRGVTHNLAPTAGLAFRFY